MTKTLKQNIEDLDLQIETLIGKLGETEDEETFNEISSQIEKLTSIRIDLSSDEVNCSNRDAWIAGGFGLASVLLVLYYEKTDVITSKAYNTATRMFKS